jgi:hypothetical protein
LEVIECEARSGKAALKRREQVLGGAALRNEALLKYFAGG